MNCATVNCRRIHKSEETKKLKKNSNFNGKTIPYAGFKPITSRIAIGKFNYCIIGSVSDTTELRVNNSFNVELREKFSILSNSVDQNKAMDVNTGANEKINNKTRE
jgi:hypothetical protein